MTKVSTKNIDTTLRSRLSISIIYIPYLFQRVPSLNNLKLIAKKIKDTTIPYTPIYPNFSMASKNITNKIIESA